MKTILILCVCIGAVLASPMLQPLSDEMIDYVNSVQTSWKAGRSFEGRSIEDVRKLLGVKKGDRTGHKIKEVEIVNAPPASFDARTQWPNCPSIGEIRDQAACGSCWAFGAVEAMTDRYCIYSNGDDTPHISAEDLNSCCATCGAGCNGGDPAAAWSYWVRTGLVTGGNYNSNEGCEPYTVPSCDHHIDGSTNPCGNTVSTPACTKKCISSYGTTYENDKRFGNHTYGIPNNVTAIQNEILTNGPVECDFNVFTDFLSYKSGIYHRVSGTYEGGHAVKMLGWGTENGEDYWLIANSWNPSWGENGFFRIRRGVNECGIEGDIQAGVPCVAGVKCG